MIGTYAFSCTIVVQPDGQSILQLTKSQRYNDTHAGEIKQTGVNTTQDGTTSTIEELQ